jgi:hypothetical protein
LSRELSSNFHFRDLIDGGEASGQLPREFQGRGFGSRLWTRAAALEFNPDLGRQIMPVELKILNNFALDVAGLRLQYRIKELAPPGPIATSHSVSTQGCNAHGHRCHRDLPS